MDKRDMRELIDFANIRCKKKGLKLSQISVKECVLDMQFMKTVLRIASLLYNKR